MVSRTPEGLRRVGGAAADHDCSATKTMTEQQQPSSSSPGKGGKAALAIRKRLKMPHFFRSSAAAAAANDRVDLTAREDREGPLTCSSSEETSSANELQNQTRVLTILETPSPPVSATAMEHDKSDEEEEQWDGFADTPPEPFGPFCASAALLRLNYFERMCGVVDTKQIPQEAQVVQRLDGMLPDDPSPQESIECVFAAQLALMDLDDEMDLITMKDLQTPSSLQQCLLKNRLNSNSGAQFLQNLRPTVVRRKENKPDNAETLVDVDSKSDTQSLIPVSSATTDTCPCHCRTCPVVTPEGWPQRPLLLRPTPYGGTVVKGIRFAGQTSYLWSAQDATTTTSWPNALQQHWRDSASTSPTARESPTSGMDVSSMCPHCMILPINNGKELPGESLVVDFESDAFDGSMLVRLKDSHGTTCAGRENPKGYFDGLHRRYQVVVQGRFKYEIPWTECFSGFQ
jgi:Protein of unknown function (DUF1769)